MTCSVTEAYTSKGGVNRACTHVHTAGQRISANFFDHFFFFFSCLLIFVFLFFSFLFPPHTHFAFIIFITLLLRNTEIYMHGHPFSFCSLLFSSLLFLSTSPLISLPAHILCLFLSVFFFSLSSCY